jgi:hypothetical protein
MDSRSTADDIAEPEGNTSLMPARQHGKRIDPYAAGNKANAKKCRGTTGPSLRTRARVAGACDKRVTDKQTPTEQAKRMDENQTNEWSERM